MAVLSNYSDVPVDSSACLIGEVGLGGEVRAVPQAELRIAEAIKLGFDHIIFPKANLKSAPKVGEKITLRPVEHVQEVRALVL
jgi:DNA repair protein RadA/Sms